MAGGARRCGQRPFGPRVHLIALAVVLAPPLVVQTASVEACAECGSTRRVSQTRVGIEQSSSLPISPVREDVVETKASRDLVGPGHEHRWDWRIGRAGGRFLLSSTCCFNVARSLPNPFVRDWEENLAFRRLVEAERAAGRLTAAEVVAIARIPLRPGWRVSDDPAIGARIARAQALFAASGAADRDGAWARWIVPPRSSRGCPGPPKR